MQQYNNDMENKLRQLENQQLPDLSAMDTHWKEMQNMLSPGIAVPGKRSSSNKYFKKILIAASIITALSIFIMKYGSKDHYETGLAARKDNKAGQLIIKKEGPVQVPSDTSIKVTVVTVNGVKPAPIKIKTRVAVINYDTAKQTNVLKIVDGPAIPLHVADLSISSFYYQIQKPAQEFLLNAAKGGEIICNEGTKITIPPAAFVDGNGNAVNGDITINVTEYYKYSDMITANLTTTSNGEQLVTGGMIKLTALQNNQQVQLRNDKALNLAMPTKNYDAEMQLFVADENKQGNKSWNSEAFLQTNIDTTAPGNLYSRNLNWLISDISGWSQFDGKTKFLNMQDLPEWILETSNKRTAKFFLTKESPMTVAEAKKILKEKYGDHYDVIKVKKIKPDNRKLLMWKLKDYDCIGDSVRLSVDEAIKGHYIDKKDSAFYVQKTKADSIKFIRARSIAWTGVLKTAIWEHRSDRSYSARFADSLNNSYQQRLKVEQAYNFSVNRMGWINCDKFYNYKDKTDFVLDLPADVQADKFVTQIVFTNIRSVMPGQYQQNKIGFLNIPKDMPVYVVGLGERNGKVVSFMQALKTSGSPVSIKELDETTPEAFKEKLKQLDL
jgi:hypothetical protein